MNIPGHRVVSVFTQLLVKALVFSFRSLNPKAFHHFNEVGVI